MSNMSEQRSIDEALFEWSAAKPALKCSVCEQCGATAFPVSSSCTACGSENMRQGTLPARGRLWTYTIQHFMPKTPYSSDETGETFRPFAIGYVEFPGTLRIETRIPLEPGADLEINMPMDLAFYKHRTEEDGTEIMNYEFRPSKGTTV